MPTDLLTLRGALHLLKGRALLRPDDTQPWRTPARMLTDLDQSGLPDGPAAMTSALLMLRHPSTHIPLPGLSWQIQWLP